MRLLSVEVAGKCSTGTLLGIFAERENSGPEVPKMAVKYFQMKS